jgi:prolipoprotein diacylglyceryl transferase
VSGADSVGTVTTLHTFIPSPSNGVWHLGPLPIRGYAFCIIIGIFAAVALSDRRWRARGGPSGAINEISTWAVPFGLVGGRLYHVITDWSDYFGKGGSPVRSLEIWKGGLGIPGAVALGALGAYIVARRRGFRMPSVADTLTPGLVLAQGIGRWGNWFNQELYGRPSNLPWAVRIDYSHQVDIPPADVHQPYGTYQPTFLYESLWDLGTAAILILADRRYKLGHGRVFALYLVVYGIGRGWVEALRIDPAHHILGLRLNDWTSIVIVIAGAIGFMVSSRRHPGREPSVLRVEVAAAANGPDSDPAATDDLASVAAVEAPTMSDAEAFGSPHEGESPPGTPAPPDPPAASDPSAPRETNEP